MSLRDRIADVLPCCVRVRHDLHRHPELGYDEHRTSAVVMEQLGTIGVAYQSGLAKGTGVLAWLPATVDGENAKTVALRADMDALPIHEENSNEYRSTRDGVMHACGHDGHTSILLGAAKVLSEIERPNNVLMLFQPAEEGGAGGKAMCDDGVLDGAVMGKPVDQIFGLHGFPMGELGKVYTRNGPMMAAASAFEITVHGKGTHAAYPHFGIDPILVAAHIITALQSITSRNVDPLDAMVITIGKVEAGVAHNVIPDSALLIGTLRALTDATDQFGRRRVAEVAENIARAFGATVEVSFNEGYPVTRNDPNATEIVREIARSALGEDNLQELENPSMGGEDFSFYGQRVPASFFFLGLKPGEQESYANLHSPTFDFNDDAIPFGIEMMCRLATN
jgi:amidohydrolase